MIARGELPDEPIVGSVSLTQRDSIG